MNRIYLFSCSVRAIMLSCMLLVSIHAFSDFTKPTSGDNDLSGEQTGGWTPTDAGLVIQLHEHDQFRLSTVIKKGGKDVEFFVCDNQNFNNPDLNHFGYTQGTNILKLIPRNPDGSYPAGSLWTVGAPLKRKTGKTNYSLVHILL